MAHTVSHPTTAPTPTATRTTTQAPLLLLFASRTSGQARRLEGFVAHVLQRRHNHDSFRFRVVMQEDRADLFERLHVSEVPTLLVIDGKRVVRRLEGYVRPHDVEDLLTPWLH
jgi:hypothetical protein